MKIASTLLAASVLWCLAPHSPAFAHWPDQAPHQIAHLGEFQFEGGGKIPNLRMSYVIHGKLNAAKDNAILFQHGMAANHHSFDHMIGPGKPLDTDKYFIICPDALGATQTTFEHSTSPTNSGLKMTFPYYNLRDMVKANYRLLTQELGIAHLLAVTGVSMGAMQSVQFAVSYPGFMDAIFPIVGGALWGTDVAYFLGSLQILSIEVCKGWDGGNYDENPNQCASNALSVMIPYFYTREWWDQYVDTPEAYTNWRNNWGAYYLDIQDARDLYYLRKSFMLSWLGNTPGFNGDVNAALRSIKAKALFIGSPQDQFYLPHHTDTQVKAIPNARALWIDSSAGHFICCNADPNATRRMGDEIRAFLGELSAKGETSQERK